MFNYYRVALYYGQMDYVMRTHWHNKLVVHGPKLKWLPLGMTNGFGRPPLNSILPASKRKFRCSFRGTRWESRRSFFFALNQLSEQGRLNCEINWGFSFGQGIALSGFRQELLQSAFVLCPPGNYNPDSYRIYEALFAGAIPIIPRHHQFDPLGIGHPIPMVDSWHQVADVIEAIEAQEGLDQYQQRVFSWWHAFVEKLQNEVAVTIG